MTDIQANLPKLSPKLRFLSALFGGNPDRIPVGNVVSVITYGLMDAAGVGFPEAHLSADAMAQLAASGHDVLGFDTVMPVFSVTQEAEAIGCKVIWGARDAVPAVRSHPFAESGDLSVPEGWMEASSIQVILDAIGLLRKRLGENVVIMGKAMGPWTLSYHMMGAEDYLMSTIAEPDDARRSLDALKSVTIEFARAQMRAGAHVICIADHATGGMVSPTTYRDMLLPVHQEILGELGCPTILHCCGNTTDRLQYFAQAGFDCYHFESQVDIDKAVETARGKMTLMGNINNAETLLRKTPDEVAMECHRAIDAGVQILAPECAVPLGTPVENLRALVQVAEERRRK